MPCWYDHFDLLYTYVLLLGIACLANHTAIHFALYQPLYQVFIDMTSNELRPPWSNNWHTPWHNIKITTNFKCRRNVDQCFRNAFAYLQLRDNEAVRIVKSGIGCRLMLDMDGETFRRHFRLTRQQYEVLNGKLTETGGELNSELGGLTRMPQNFKTLIFLWYMANQNSFRELGDIFHVAQSTAHNCDMSHGTSLHEMAKSVTNKFVQVFFARWTGIDNVPGAIDGCHIRLQRPKRHGSDYRKCYYSLPLQSICGYFFVFIVTIDSSMYLCVHDK